MDAKQQSAAHWREVVFLGDFFRLPPVRPLSPIKAEMHWHYFAESFFHLCRLPAAQGTKLSVRLVQHNDQARQDVRRFYANANGTPAPEQNDVWVNAKTNVRSRIMADIQETAVYRGVPLVLNLHLEELPNTHMVYNVPTP